jgi:hypothetical protein
VNAGAAPQLGWQPSGKYTVTLCHSTMPFNNTFDTWVTLETWNVLKANQASGTHPNPFLILFLPFCKKVQKVRKK